MYVHFLFLESKFAENYVFWEHSQKTFFGQIYFLDDLQNAILG